MKKDEYGYPDAYWGNDITLADPAEAPLGEKGEQVYLGEITYFSKHQTEVAIPTLKKKRPFLKYHIPLDSRGAYKLDSFPGKLGEEATPGNYARCTAERKAGGLCQGRAINYSGLCSLHGGMMHPLDRRRIDWTQAPRHVRFKHGKLPVSEMTDEELGRGQVQYPDGNWTNFPVVNKEVHQERIQRLFERGDELLRENFLMAVETFGEIASGTAYEPADRLRAAEFIFTRLRGKVPQEVKIGIDKPFEQVMKAVMTGGSRSESRRARGLEEDVLDAEVVDDDELDAFAEQKSLTTAEIEKLDLVTLDEDDYDYKDDRDKPVREMFKPEPVRNVGEAGKPYYDPPVDERQRQRFNEQTEDHRRAAEQKFEEFQKKKNPDEIAKERKAHQEEVRAQFRKRKFFQNQGQSSLPQALEVRVVGVTDDEGDEIDLRDINQESDLAAGDTIEFQVDLSRVNKDER